MLVITPTIRRSAVLVAAGLLFALSGIATAQTTFTLTRSVQAPGSYEAGSSVDITVRLDLQPDGTLTALGLEETAPEGWSYQGTVGGTEPAIAPMNGTTGLLEFAWFPVPETTPIIFTYRLLVSPATTGVQTITGVGICRILEVGEHRTRNVATVVPPAGTGALHSADTDASLTISLSELLRVIQFYNLVGYQCAEPAESTEDGYLPGDVGPFTCTPHASDYNPQDWTINLSELLRLIQFYNIGGYYGCEDPESEDGFCAD